MPKRISSSLFYCFRFESAVSIVHLEDDELFPPVGFEPISKARNSLPLGEAAHLHLRMGDIAPHRGEPISNSGRSTICESCA